MYAGLGQKLSGWGAMIGNILAHPGSNFFLFFLNVSASQADYEYVPNYEFQCECRPRAGSKVRNRHFCVFLPFEVICWPAPTRISEIRICGIQIFLFYTNCEKKLFVHIGK
jgi:hypothetical protein